MKDLGGVLFPEKYFTAMFDCLERRGNCWLITAKAEEKFVGGIVTVQNRHCVDYYLSMFDRKCDEMQASTAAFHFLVNYAKGFGTPILNLQSSPAAQTDLIRFKESWGAQRAQHRYLTKIVNNRDKVLSLTESEIKKNFQFHYLLPFEALRPEMARA